MFKTMLCLCGILLVSFNSALAWDVEGGSRHRGIGGVYIEVSRGGSENEIMAEVNFSGGTRFTPGYLFVIASPNANKTVLGASNMDEARELFLKIDPSEYQHFVSSPSTFIVHIPEEARNVWFLYYGSKVTSADESNPGIKFLIDTYGIAMDFNSTNYNQTHLSR